MQVSFNVSIGGWLLSDLLSHTYRIAKQIANAFAKNFNLGGYVSEFFF